MSLEAGSEVRSVDNPGRTGTITNRSPRKKPSGTYYQVRWSDGGVDYVHEEQLEGIETLDAMDPFSLVKEGRFGRARDLRRNLTYVHLSGKLANLVYAMGITNTDFYPHQYRPLLALLDSPINGMLIADEVGLGKTIEAGLIWTEFRARLDMRLLVVVCPAMLREKWRDELQSRFGVDARIVMAEEFLDSLKKARIRAGAGQALIISYQAARPERSWRGTEGATKARESARNRLADFLLDHAEEDALIDMVVFDEAHYMRNSDSATWRLGELLQGVSHYQIMLSATPINLKNRDLFNLLRLLDPDQFADEIDFAQALEANQPLVAARDAALTHTSSVEDITTHLEAAAQHPRLETSHQLQYLLDNPPTDQSLEDRRFRVRLADSLERLNLLSHVITRTRKKDVQSERVRRDVHREGVEMTEEEQKVYELVTRLIRQYAMENGINDGFLLAGPQRQVTSCPAAAVQGWVQGSRNAAELDEEFMLEADSLGNSDPSVRDLRPLRSYLSAAVSSEIDVAKLRSHDSKFERFCSVLSEHLQAFPDEKLIVFTSFRATARYLVERLHERGIPGTLIWGNQDQTKQEVITAFRKSPKSRVLVSTEVAAEGVDLQFCRVLVNYDLPWNPTRIEQRIGRIDRLGQQSPIIHIWNLYFNSTIDQRVITRLLDRLRLFEEALGESEAVVGEQIRHLESRILSRDLSPEEEEHELERTATALENIRRHREELERNAAHMMAHGQLVLERIEAADRLARRVTDRDLYVYVRDYLELYSPGHQFVQDGADPMRVDIEIPSSTRADFEEYLNREGLLGQTELCAQARPCRFLNRISEKGRRGEEIIHQFHPLIRFISHDLKERNEHFYRLVAVRASQEDMGLNVATGIYVFYIRSWRFSGVRDEEVLAVAAAELSTGSELDEDLADQLVQLARLTGRAWVSAANELNSDTVLKRMDRLESSLEQAYREEVNRKRNENIDRARFQEESVRRHLNRRLPILKDVKQRHLENARESLARATQGQIDKLQARMEARLKRIRQKADVLPETDFVCAGVIQLE